MKKLISGIHQFRKDIFESKKKLFGQLKDEQNPETLFITCSDSRITPALFTQTEPGDLFIIRNAGNIIPPHSETSGGEAATIEYAIKGLGVKDIIICGHSGCGAMCQLMNPQDGFPVVDDWLKHAHKTREIVNKNYHDLDAEVQREVAVEENVLVQIEHLRAHPAVKQALSEGTIKLHAWVYQPETGKVFTYVPEREQYELL